MDGIVCFLNGDRGIAVLRSLMDKGHGVGRVVVPSGKNLPELPPLLAGSGCVVTASANVNDAAFIAELARYRPKLSIIAGFSTIFCADLLTVPEYGTLNLHAGRLPEYRGGSPLNWQIINGEAFAGLSVIQADSGIDTGRVMAEADVPIGPDETISSLHLRANEVFPRLVLEVVEALDGGRTIGRDQDEARARYWHQRSDADGRLDFRAMTAEEVCRMVRALGAPYPGAFSFLGDQLVRILEAEIPAETICGVPGRVCHIQRRGPYVVCRDRAILVRKAVVGGDASRRLRHGEYLT